MSYESFQSAFMRARSMNNSTLLQAEMVRSGDITAYIERVTSVMLEWYAKAPAKVQAGLTDKGEINFRTSFPGTYGGHLRQIAEKRHETILYPWGINHPVRLADYDSIPGLMAAVTNPMAVPRDVLRTEETVIIHFPYQGFLTGKRNGKQIELSYLPYQHVHLHLRNFNNCDRKPELCQVQEILLNRYGKLEHGVRAIDVTENGWLIAQKLGAMLTVMHQEGGDPEYASYTSYGPFYPHDFLVTEENGQYDFEYQFNFVTV